MANVADVLKFIKQEGAVTANQLMAEFDLSRDQVYVAIGELLRRKKIRPTTEMRTRGVFWYLNDGSEKQANPFTLRKQVKEGKKLWSREEFHERVGPQGNYDAYVKYNS